MDGGGDGGGWLAMFAVIIVLAALIGRYAARASSLDIRRQAEERDLQALFDLQHDDYDSPVSVSSK